MVTGAYYPEGSGISFQCRELVRALKDRVTFTILTTSTDPRLAAVEEIDGVPVVRVRVDPTRWLSKGKAALHLTLRFIQLRRRFELVHLHGFSQKSLLLVLLAKLFRKGLVLKITSAGGDDPLSVRSKSPFAFRFYAQADRFLGVSPRIQQAYEASSLPSGRFRFIPNGVDGNRFRTGGSAERTALRRELRLPEDLFLILFVGFFSREKQPDFLFKAWASLQTDGLVPNGLIFIGATRSHYYEVDPRIAQGIRAEAQRLGVEKRIFFVESTHEIEKFYRAADLFVLPSLREGLPNALLEAMASGLPCIASRLPGVTDVIMGSSSSCGILVPAGDLQALGEALRSLIQDRGRAQILGQIARERVLEEYPISQTAKLTLEVYRELMRKRSKGES